MTFWRTPSMYGTISSTGTNSADLVVAQDLTELLRRVCGHLPTQQDPGRAPCFIGCPFSYRIEGGDSNSEIRAEFHGWHKSGAAGFIMAPFAAKAWLGVLVPFSPSAAVLHRVWLTNVPADIVSRIWDYFSASRIPSAMGVACWSLLLRDMGFPAELSQLTA